MNGEFRKRFCQITFNESMLETSRRINIGRTAVEKWKYGLCDPSMKSIIKICKEYDVSADWLLGLSDKK